MTMERIKTGDFPEILEALGVCLTSGGSLRASGPLFVGIDRLHRRFTCPPGATE